MMKINFTKIAIGQSRGFTLLETMIAVLVLMIAIVGPLNIVQKSLQSTTLAKDQDSAFYLAQEAVEYVRWARDTNTLQPAPGTLDWLVGGTINSSNATVLSPACVSADGSASCYLDAFAISPAFPTPCPTLTTCPALNYDNSLNRFTYASIGGSVVSTIFKRTIIVTSPVTGTDCTIPGKACEANITVVVSWTEQDGVNSCSFAGITGRCVIVSEDMLNWQPAQPSHT